MTQPHRLSESAGPASRLLRAGTMRGPSPASRAKALAVVGTAAGLAKTGTAVAGTAKLVASGGLSLGKSIALCVLVGAAGGGLVSVAVSTGVAKYDAHSAESIQVGAPPVTTAKPRAINPQPDITAVPERVEPATPAELAPSPAPAAAPIANAPSASTVGTNAPAASAPHPGLTPEAPPAAPRASTGSFDQPPASAAPSTLLDEVKAIEAARAAARRGDANGTLAALDNYSRAYPRPQFGPEALALRIEALSRSGSMSQARALATQFARIYPTHPLLSRVEAAVR